MATTDAFGGDDHNCDHETAAVSHNNSNNSGTWNDTMKGSTSPTRTASNAVSMKLAKSESTQHMIGMKEVYAALRQRQLQIRAHTVTHNTNHNNNQQKRNYNSNKTMIVHFIRHGQGFHNLLADMATESGIQWKQFDASSCNTNPYMRKEVLDAPLTEIGRYQAQLLQGVLPQNNNGTINTFTANSTTIQDDTETSSSSSFVSVVQQLPTIDIVYASPHCRTLQTGIIALQQYVNTDTPFIAHELLREESGIHVCDQRRSIEQQRMEFPQYNFALFCPSNIDPLFRPQYRETKLEVASRIYQFMEFLATKDYVQIKNDFSNIDKAVLQKSSIAVVTHSGWLHTLFNAVIHEDCDPSLKEWWNTGELRTVELEFIWIDNNQQHFDA